MDQGPPTELRQRYSIVLGLLLKFGGGISTLFRYLLPQNSLDAWDLVNTNGARDDQSLFYLYLDLYSCIFTYVDSLAFDPNCDGILG